MGSTAKHHFSSSSKLFTKNPSTSSDTEDKNPNPNPNPNPYSCSSSSALHAMESDAVITPLTIEGAEGDSLLCNSEFLTREEVIRRRSRRVKQLQKFYKDHYWALMEELRVQYREYYWKFGKSPFKEEEEKEKENGGGINGGAVEGSCDSNSNNNDGSSNNKNGGRLGLGFGENRRIDEKNKRCAFTGCKSKPMALTNYCHTHILSDNKQKLYKACTYVIKSAQSGPVHCGKPILRATVPSLCSVHFQKAQKHVTRALKKAGLNISSTSNLAPKFHIIVAESVRQINAKRRERRGNVENLMVNSDKKKSDVVVKEEAAG